MDNANTSDTAANLRARFPHLETLDKSTKSRFALGAANLRRELKKAFPGVRFSVTSESYSGGCSIHVDWHGGPAFEAIQTIANKYQEGTFDGMDDSYTYNRNAWPQVFGGAKYVLCQRERTPEEQAAADREWQERQAHLGLVK